MLKRILCLVLALFLLFAFAACSIVDTIDQVPNADAVVATAFGHTITKQQLYIAIANYIGNYDMTMEDIAKEPELQEKLVNDFVNDTVMDYVLTENAADYGYVYTAQDQEAFEAEFAEFLASLDENNKKNALEDGMTESQYENKRLDLRRQYFVLLGYDSEEQYKNYQECAFIAGKVESCISEAVTVDADAVRAYYDNMLTAGKTEMPVTYTFSISNPSIPLYCPKGYRYVKSLMLEFPAASVLANAEYYSNGETNKLNAAIDRDVAYIQDTIDEIRARLDAGDDFDALLEEYGKDNGMKMEPYKSHGYIAITGDSSMIPSYRDACERLTDTEMVTECATYKGYWFLQATEIVDEGPMPFDEICAAMTNELVAMKKNLQYSETTASLLDELKASGDVTIDTNNFFQE